MPKTPVVIYCEEDGHSPLIEWLDQLPQRVLAKCLVRIERLAEFGHELRRPEADFLRDGIYELRVSFQGTQYRILYFFHRTLCVVLSHGLMKEAIVPPREIERAISRKRTFEADPSKHTYKEK
jgi:phage-related protein